MLARNIFPFLSIKFLVFQFIPSCENRKELTGALVNPSEAELMAARVNTAKRFDIIAVAIQDLADAINKERAAAMKVIQEKDEKIRELQVPMKSKVEEAQRAEK